MFRRVGRLSSSLTLKVLLAGLTAFVMPHRMMAQTVTGTLQGTARDSSGGVLPGVTIAVRNTETGLERSLVTNEKGLYRVPFLPLGYYRVTASLPNFGTVVRERVEVTLNSTTVADFTLNPRVTEEVRVSAEQLRINTTNGEIKGSFTAEQIQAMPSANQGSFLALAESFPGFQENPTSGQNNPTASSGSSINFNGTGTRGATFQINGVSNNDSSENQNRQGVALSTIKEFQIITNNYSAEFGGGYGAVVLVQTKSGTNGLRGDLYAFRQQSGWNEKAFFSRNQPKPANHRNEYGATAGFPVFRDQLFGFLAFDQTERAGNQAYTRDVILQSDKELPRLTRGNDTPENRAFIESVLARFGNLTPNDPTRTPRTFAGQIGINQPDKDYSGRIDWGRGSTDTVSLRGQYTRQIRESDDVIIGEQALQNNKQENFGLTWTHVFSPSTTGEFRYGLGLRSTHVDIAAGNDTPIIRFSGTTFASIIGNAGGFPISRKQTDHQFVYNLSRLVGSSHFIKAGTDIRLGRLDDLAQNNGRGSYSFTPNCGGQIYPSSFAAFFDGCVTSYVRAYAPFFLENRLNEYNLYVEDSWQPQSNFTLNLGVRYEYVAAPKEVGNRIDYEFKDDKNNVEPRVSFAYQPTWHGGFLGWLTGGPGNASLRGGYGIYHGRIFQSVFSQTGASIRTNPPNAVSLTFLNSLNIADPTEGFVFVPGPQPTRHAETHAAPNLQMPYVHQWNASFERKIPFDATLRISYTGTHGVGLLQYTLDNLPITPAQGGIVVVDHPNNAPRTGFPDLRGKRIDRVAADFRCAGTGLPGIPTNAQCPVPVPIADNEISLRVPRTNERRPDPRFTTNLLINNGSTSDYNALQVEVGKRLTRDLQFLMSYTLSKAIDTGSEATFVGAGDTNITGPDPDFKRGLSRFDTRHRFTFNGYYRLPFFQDRKDLLGQLLGGWQIAGVVKIASGTPFTVIDTRTGDINWDGYNENRPVLADHSVNGHTVDDPDTSQQKLPRSAFRSGTPDDSTTDLVGRNTFFLDGVRNVDIALSKTFSLPWTHLLSVRLEVFNVFDRVQFGFPVNDLASENFGRILTTSNGYGPRTLQAGVRYSF